MGKVRAPGREGRRRLGWMLLVLLIVGVVRAAFSRGGINRIARLLRGRLRIIRRSPRHGGRVCRGTRRRVLEDGASNRDREGDGGWLEEEGEKTCSGRTRTVMKNEGRPCAKGVSRGFISGRSRLGGRSRVGLVAAAGPSYLRKELILRGLNGEKWRRKAGGYWEEGWR